MKKESYLVLFYCRWLIFHLQILTAGLFARALMSCMCMDVCISACNVCMRVHACLYACALAYVVVFADIMCNLWFRFLCFIWCSTSLQVLTTLLSGQQITEHPFGTTTLHWLLGLEVFPFTWIFPVASIVGTTTNLFYVLWDLLWCFGYAFTLVVM